MNRKRTREMVCEPCEQGEAPVRTVFLKPVPCEQCGERAAVLLDLRDHKRWCDECWRWRWAE